MAEVQAETCSIDVTGDGFHKDYEQKSLLLT
jgi:hypothetical protein